jgi:opine dehydrogenase
LDVDSIAVIGDGNAGHAIAADLTLAGYKVNMCMFPDLAKNLKAVIQRGGIEIIGQARTGFAKLNKVTTDAKEAIAGTQLVIVAVIGPYHQHAAEALAPYLKGQTVFLNPGHTGGALEFAHILKKKAVKGKVTVCECSPLTYGCRLSGPAKVNVLSMHKEVLFSSLPAVDTEPIYDFIKSIYPEMVKASDVIESSLADVNAMIHPPGMIMNAGWIEHTNGDFNYYSEAITPTVGKVLGKLDEDRRAIMTKYGYKSWPFPEWYYRLGNGNRPGNSVYEAFQLAVEEKHVKAPSSLQHRYITEDVPYGLVPMEALAKIAKVETPTISACIDFLSLMMETDYRKDGLTAKRMGIDGMTLPTLQKYVRTGS